MIAFCPDCKNIFDSRAISGGSNLQITFKGIQTQEQCPVCGKHNAFILEGTFKIDEKGVAELLSGPQFTVDILSRFRTLAQKAKDNNYNVEQFVIEAAEISPQIGLVARYMTRDNVRDLIMIITFILTVLDRRDPKTESNPSPTTTINYNVVNNQDVINYYQSAPSKAKNSPPQRGSSYTSPKKPRKR